MSGVSVHSSVARYIFTILLSRIPIHRKIWTFRGASIYSLALHITEAICFAAIEPCPLPLLSHPATFPFALSLRSSIFHGTMDKNTNRKNSFRNVVPLLIILVVGIGIRTLNLYFFANSPIFTPFSPDEIYHHLWAQRIASGDIIPQGVFFRAPLYPYLLALFYTIFGSNFWSGRLLGLLIGAATILLGYPTTRRLAKNRTAGLISAGIFAITPVFFYFESRLLLDSFLVPIALAMLYFLLRFLDSDTISDLFWAGLFGGLFAITRPTILVVLAVLFIYLVVRRGRAEVKSSANLRRALIFALGAAILILPVMVWNISRGVFVPISSQGGINFYIGNNSKSDGVSAALPELGDAWEYSDAARLASSATHKTLSAAGVSHFYFAKGLRFWHEHPSRAALLFAKKLYLLFHRVFIGNNGDMSFFRHWSPLLYIPLGMGVIAPLGLIGLLLLGKDDKAYILWLVLLSYSFAIALFFVNTRFSLPLYAVLVPAASLFLVKMPSLWREWSARRKFLLSGVFLILVVLLNVDFLGAHNLSRGDYKFAMGISLISQGKFDEARSAFEQSLVENPSKRGAHLNLGIIAMKKKDISTAFSEFKMEAKVKGDVAKALSNLGVIARLKGNERSALDYGTRAIAVEGPLEEPYYNLAMSYYHFRRFRDGLATARKGYSFYPTSVRLAYAAGAGFQSLGEADSAIVYFERAIENAGRSFVESYDRGSALQHSWGVSSGDEHIVALAHHNIALELARDNDIDDAESHLVDALYIEPNLIDARIQLGNVYLKEKKPSDALEQFDIAQELGDSSALLYHNRAIALSQLGEFDSALVSMRTAFSIDSTLSGIRRRLATLDSLARQ